jgi:hypothetical protein
VVAIGLLLFAGALGGAATLVIQNGAESAVRIHVFGHSLTLQPYSIMAAGAAIALLALIGIVLMRMGAGRARRLRRQRSALLAENARLSGNEAGAQSSFFFETFGGDKAEDPEQSLGRTA